MTSVHSTWRVDSKNKISFWVDQTGKYHRIELVHDQFGAQTLDISLRGTHVERIRWLLQAVETFTELVDVLAADLAATLPVHDAGDDEDVALTALSGSDVHDHVE